MDSGFRRNDGTRGLTLTRQGSSQILHLGDTVEFLYPLRAELVARAVVDFGDSSHDGTLVGAVRTGVGHGIIGIANSKDKRAITDFFPF